MLWWLGVLALVWLWYQWRQSDAGKAGGLLRHFPGPPALPLIGNVHQFEIDPPKLVAQVKRWYAQYKSPIRICFGPFTTVHVFRADHVEAIFKSSTNIRKSRDYDMVADWLGKGLLISDGSKWHKRRKMLTPTFHFQILRNFVTVFNEQSRVLVSILRQDTKREPTVNICKYISHCALDIICESAMGIEMGAQTASSDSDYVIAINEFAEMTLYRNMRPWLWPDFIFYNLHPCGWKTKKYLKTLHDFTRGVIRDRISEREGNVVMTDEGAEVWGGKRRQAFLDLLLEMRDKNELGEEDVREEVDTFMFEGHDTTATGIMWALFLLAKHPEYQDRAREEIQSIIGSDKSRNLSLEELTNMKYLECCVKEAQRIYPPVPLVVRRIDEPLTLDKDHVVPKGVMLNIGIFGLHLDPEQFPEPEKFDPDRFLPENSDGRHPFAFTPFAAGLRSCIGQRFAMLEEKAMIAQVLLNFRMETTAEDPSPSILLVYRPTGGVHIKFSPLE